MIHNCRGITDKKQIQLIDNYYTWDNSFKKGVNEKNEECYWTCKNTSLPSNKNFCKGCSAQRKSLAQKVKYQEKSEEYYPNDSISPKVKQKIKEITKEKGELEIKLGGFLKILDKKEKKESKTVQLSDIEVELEDKEDTKKVLELLMNGIDKLKMGSYSRKLMINQLRNFSKKPNGHRWDIEVIKHCLLIKFYGEENTYNYIRGKGYKKNKNNSLNNSKEGIALLLPSFRTLQRYTESPTFKRGIDEKYVDNILKSFDKNGYEKTFGISMDEIQVSECICYDAKTKKIVGFVDDLDLSNAKSFWDNNHSNPSSLQNKIANKVMQVFLVSCSTGVSFPIAAYPTIGVKEEKVFLFF